MTNQYDQPREPHNHLRYGRQPDCPGCAASTTTATGGQRAYQPTPIPTTFESALDLVLANLRATLISRRQKYGTSNITATGIHGLITRVGDKLARVQQDHQSCLAFECGPIRQLDDEDRLDDWRDFAGYSIIAMLLEEDLWELPTIKNWEVQS